MSPAAAPASYLERNSAIARGNSGVIKHRIKNMMLIQWMTKEKKSYKKEGARARAGVGSKIGLWRKWAYLGFVANVRGVEIAHGGDIGKYYKSGTAHPISLKKIKVCGGDL